MGFHVTLDPAEFSLDEALLFLRSRIYDDDRNAVAALFLARPDLSHAPLITDYVWNHLGNRLIDTVRDADRVHPANLQILEQLPTAEHALDALANDDTLNAERRENIRQLLARLRAHLGLARRNAMPRQEDLDDLFGNLPSHTIDDTAPQDRALRIAAIEGAARSRTVEFANDEATLRVAHSTNNSPSRLQLTATLMNLLDVPIDIHELQAVIYDRDGTMLDAAPHFLNARFKRAQEVVAELPFDRSVLDQVGRIDIRANFAFEFRARLATATVAPIPDSPQPRQRLRFDLVRHDTPPGYPEFDLELTGWYASHYQELCEFILRLTDLTPSFELAREAVIALRDGQGRVLRRESGWATLPTGAPITFKINLYFETQQLTDVRGFDVGVKGTCRRSELIGSFSVLD